MNGVMKECTFTWFIENYSHCWHLTGEELVSPEFTADGLEGTVWTVQLYPGGCKDSGFVSLFLRRNEDNGPDDFQVRFELSFLGSDGTNLHVMEWICSPKKGTREGWFRFLLREDVLYQGNTSYLPEDTLSVSCKIWRGIGNIQKLPPIYVRSRIKIEHIWFLHITESFSTMEPNQKKTVKVESPSRQKFAFCSVSYFTDQFLGEGWIEMEITPLGTNIILSQCTICLLDENGKIIECGGASNRFVGKSREINNMTLSISLNDILERKTDYLPHDKLSLLCKCIFSTGIEHEASGNTLCEASAVALNHLSKKYRNTEIYNAIDNLSACPSALDDFKAVYDNQLLADVKLKTKTKSFSAHKIVLCARSSVFKAMLTNDMKEKHTGSIQVDDLENDTVQQLLIFLYSDEVKDMQWESATKLYYAADKYEVQKLKALCSSFLVDNLNTSNASELLLLVDTHSDSVLKKVVEDFILKYDEQVFGSEEWGHLMETNSLLVSKTMRLKYIRK